MKRERAGYLAAVAAQPPVDVVNSFLVRPQALLAVVALVALLVSGRRFVCPAECVAESCRLSMDVWAVKSPVLTWQNKIRGKIGRIWARYGG